MNAPQITNRQLLQFLTTYWQWKWLWIATTVAFGALGLGYVVFLKSDKYVATQGLIVRDEANGASVRLGRFQSQTEMKAAQETILEMAKNEEVLRMALTKVGRIQSFFSFLSSGGPPTRSEILALQSGSVEVRAPRGAELGTTELIYLDVEQHSPARALELNKAICDALETQLQSVRRARADGVIQELETVRQSAEQSLSEATNRLQAMERDAGKDLGDLRALVESSSNGNINRTLLDKLNSEIQQLELKIKQAKLDLSFAQASLDNPGELLITPSRLVQSQPGLLKLREGLATALLTSAKLSGKYTDLHPAVRSAKESERQIRDQLREELRLSIESLNKDVEISELERADLVNKKAEISNRLSVLATTRADYSNATAEVRARSEELQNIEREYAQAIASREAAMTSSLVTRLNEPTAGEDPVGPGRSTILAGVTISGLFFGLGVVFLLSPLDGGTTFGRRQSDSQRPYDGRGFAARRQSDHPPSNLDNRTNYPDSGSVSYNPMPSGRASGYSSLTGEQTEDRRQHSDRPRGQTMSNEQSEAAATEAQIQKATEKLDAQRAAVTEAALNRRLESFASIADHPPQRKNAVQPAQQVAPGNTYASSTAQHQMPAGQQASGNPVNNYPASGQPFPGQNQTPTQNQTPVQNGSPNVTQELDPQTLKLAQDVIAKALGN